MDESLEGWYTDPFGRHEARWISSGRPTLLVRDGDVESHDDPPDEAPSLFPERIVPVGSPDSTRRADDAQHEYWDPQRAVATRGGGRACLIGHVSPEPSAPPGLHEDIPTGPWNPECTWRRCAPYRRRRYRGSTPTA
jgi:hypothetical protein